jgi:hypothetical protein
MVAFVLVLIHLLGYWYCVHHLLRHCSKSVYGSMHLTSFVFSLV